MVFQEIKSELSIKSSSVNIAVDNLADQRSEMENNLAFVALTVRIYVLNHLNDVLES